MVFLVLQCPHYLILIHHIMDDIQGAALTVSSPLSSIEGAEYEEGEEESDKKEQRQ